MAEATHAVDQKVNELKSAHAVGDLISISERIRMCRDCLDGVRKVAEDWSHISARFKQCPNVASVIAEEMLSGPVVVTRQLQLTIQTLAALDSGKDVCPASRVQRLPNGQVAVSVFPATGLFDRLTFMGLGAQVWMQPGIREHDIHGSRADVARQGRISGVSAVLGAGNVSSIPATDSLNRLMFEGRQVVLKMNPVNEYLAPLFEVAFASLIREGLFRIITGGADVGTELINHPDVCEVHVTGSTQTHDAIVWGADPVERQRRRQTNNPLLKKPVTSELGNVSPWIIVPGHFSNRQLNSQAQHVAASITNNASFNCLATKVIVTWRKWEQRDEFLRLVSHHLNQTALRPAYYPGAVERYRRFAATNIDPDDSNRLPWALLQGQSIDERPELFTEESFVCVCAETALDADTPEAFAESAMDFVNDQMIGSLCASITFPESFNQTHSAARDQCLQKLRYGSICVNQWSGLAYALTSPPWGAFPGATLDNVESGIGSVHNTYLLEGHEKTVLQGPLINFPKPVWFPAHRNAPGVARQLMALYYRPSVARLPQLFAAALRG